MEKDFNSNIKNNLEQELKLQVLAEIDCLVNKRGTKKILQMS